MNVENTRLPGLLILEPRVFADERGFFYESWQAERFAAVGIRDIFTQDNHSRSMAGVLRGLHFTRRRPQAQTVTVSHGRIFDVAVDLRHGSPTFGQWFGTELSGETPRMLYLPPGFAHGFCVLSECADVHYKVTHTYDGADEFGLRWNDPAIGIRWPLGAPKMKPRDAAFPLLAELTADQLPQVEFSS